MATKKCRSLVWPSQLVHLWRQYPPDRWDHGLLWAKWGARRRQCRPRKACTWSKWPIEWCGPCTDRSVVLAACSHLCQSMAVYGNLETKFQLVISSLSSIATRACTSKASTCLVAVVYCAASPMCFHLLAPTYILHLFACSCWILAACICLIRTRSICQVTDWSYLVPEGPLDQLAVDHL